MYGLQLERSKMKKIFQENTTFYELEYSICECTTNEWNSFSLTDDELWDHLLTALQRIWKSNITSRYLL